MPPDPVPAVVELVEDEAGRWWALGAPQPPAGIEPEMLLAAAATAGTPSRGPGGLLGRLRVRRR